MFSFDVMRTVNATAVGDRFVEDANLALLNDNLTLEQFWFLRGIWSRFQFGPVHKRGPVGPLKHLMKELEKELLPAAEQMPSRYNRNLSPADVEGLLEEYCDAIFLIMDAADRNGFTLTEIRQALGRKLKKNMEREWGPQTSNEPVEHVRKEGE